MPVSAFLSGCLLVLPGIGGHPHEFVVVVQHNRLWYVAVRRLPGQSRQKQLPSTPGHDCALEINIVDTVLWPQPHNQPRDRCGENVTGLGHRHQPSHVPVHAAFATYR